MQKVPRMYKNRIYINISGGGCKSPPGQLKEADNMTIKNLYASAYENAIKNTLEGINKAFNTNYTYKENWQEGEKAADFLQIDFDENGDIIKQPALNYSDFVKVYKEIIKRYPDTKNIYRHIAAPNIKKIEMYLTKSGCKWTTESKEESTINFIDYLNILKNVPDYRKVKANYTPCGWLPFEIVNTSPTDRKIIKFQFIESIDDNNKIIWR